MVLRLQSTIVLMNCGTKVQKTKVHVSDKIQGSSTETINAYSNRIKYEVKDQDIQERFIIRAWKEALKNDFVKGLRWKKNTALHHLEQVGIDRRTMKDIKKEMTSQYSF